MINERETASVRRKYNRNAGVFNWMDRLGGDPTREAMIRQAVGRVLEIGVGTGKNLHYYDPAVTAELVGIDFSPGMLEKAKEKENSCRVPLTLLEMDAQRMTFPDASFDTVLATCVFCTVPDPVLGLQEARRVCKPGGKVLLLEHMRVDRPVIGTLMDVVNPLVVAMVGTHINRRTVENVRLAGLTIESVTKIHGDLMKLIVARP